MPGALFELSFGAPEEREAKKILGVALGQVINNVDATGQARVQVLLPWMPGVTPWARVVAVGAGMARGFYSLPQIGDEVLVAFNQGDIGDAYVLGGLWSTIDRPPALLPTDPIQKRVLRTTAGHTIELDDALQTITITTSTQQQVTLGPAAIELRSGLLPAGQISSVSLDAAGNASVRATGSLSLEAPTITIKGGTVEITGAGTTTVQGGGECVVRGGMVRIN
jgi:uncharacterized protein involved in type VI secretion and phage assembly